MKTLLTSIFALFLVFGYKATPTKQISGTVTSAADGLSLPNASIQSFPSKTRTASKSDGKYSLKIPNTDTYLMITCLYTRKHF